MEIIEYDFKLKPISDDYPLFDLELLYTIKPRGGKSRLEFKNAGYGLSIESAIKKIIHYRISCNHKDETITLRTYLNEYKRQLDSIKELL